MKSCSASPTSSTAPTSTSGGGATAEARAKRLHALVRLIGDESPHVWDTVRVEILREGRRARPELGRAARSDEPRARSRARTLLADIERRPIVRRLCGFASRPDLDLEEALFLLARYTTPSLDPRPCRRRLDTLAAELLDRSRHLTGDLARSRAIGQYLGIELGFGGSKGEFHHPDNIHLPRVLEQRAGMPLSLCAVYLFVARRLGLRAGILPLPGHVMLRLHEGTKSLIVDPYHKGQERTERECRRYIEQNQMHFEPSMLREASDRAMFKRQLQNLARSAEKRGLRRELDDVALVVRALEPASASHAARGTGSPRGRRR